MYIKFWGTRGSIPTPISGEAIKQKIQRALEGAAGLNLADETILKRYLDRLPWTVQGTVGGNTSCLEIRSGDQLLILDAGSGLKWLGHNLMEKGFAKGYQQADFLISHTHWDHIQGFPFFQPLFVPHNHFTFYSPFPDLAERLARQQHPDFFPVPLTYMRATIEFKKVCEEQWYQIGNFRIYPLRLPHPGLTYGYRIEDEDSCLVYVTDSEYKQVDPTSTERYVQFFQKADLLIFDAQYTLTEALDKLDWGHSTALIGAELACRAQVKRSALFHHDPASSDEKIWAAKEQAEAYLLHHYPDQQVCELLVAYDGLSLEI